MSEPGNSTFHGRQKIGKRLSVSILLIRDIQRDPFDGIGKPEPLSGNLSSWWSRRIDDANRIVYKVEGDIVVIAACKSHYS